MERSTKKNGLLNLAILLVVGITAFVIARLTQSMAGQVCALFMGIGFLVAAVSWFQMRLEEREQLEKLELDELSKGRGSSTLFESKDAEVFPAQRSREQFERFFVPGFTVLLCLLEAVGALVLWRWLTHSTTIPDMKQPTIALALFGMFALILFLFGKFSSTIARLGNHRLLRPSAGWVLMSAYLCFIVALGIIGVETDTARDSGFFKTDLYVARGLTILLGLIALETLLNLILEIYRPRVRGKVARPLYESRLVGLLGQPEGLITTAAQALDYQFGFKVSETWFYRFFEKALGWLLLLQLGVLFVSTSLVFIEPGEQGVLERFGRPVENRTVLNPGAHLKFPWPIDRVHRYRTEQIQTFNVGYTPDREFQEQPALLWTMAHPEEENFLVANRERAAVQTTTDSTRRPPPVSLLTVSIPVQFQITNLLAWIYNTESPSNVLQNLATREAVRYFVNADLNEVMSRERLEASEMLRTRIQESADRHQLGVRILFVGLQDIHPPVKVATDYEKVISAKHQMQARILAAQAEAIRTNALARAQATNLINQAVAQRVTLEINAHAQAALFTNQLPAFQAAPSVYRERAYLQALARSTADARKYVLLTTNAQNVFTIDLQDRIRADLLDLSARPE